MSSSHPPDGPPPSYESVTGSSSASASAPPIQPIRRVSTDGPGSRRERNGIPPEHRRSMEDENRPLPPGWVRQFDSTEHHQYFVDTNSNPPRSIWMHPYDDEDFLSTLSPEERKTHGRMHRTMTMEDLAAESSDDEAGGHHTQHTSRAAGASTALPPRPNQDNAPKGLHKFTRKMKDKITASTHEERLQSRAQREKQERRAYAVHMQARQAMARAIQTGEPQFLCKDQQGRDVYIEPPPRAGGMYGGYGGRGYGYNPYGQGRYGNPNARFMRPTGPYGRPYGYGYGGGLGAPVAAGFLGGALLGGVLF